MQEGFEGWVVGGACDARIKPVAWIVEINDFLPPLAGCGVFKYGDPDDRSVTY